MSSLPKNNRNSQRFAPASPQAIHRKAATSPQMELFDTSPAQAHRGSGRKPAKPLLAIYATESECKQVGGGRWWNIRCSYDRRMFGGLYSIAERDIILKGFDGRTAAVSLDEFEAAAKFAMKAAAQGAES